MDHRLCNNADVIAWMEGLYLSELVVLKVNPAPRPPAPKRRVPQRVTLELGMTDHQHEGAQERFFVWSLVASGVTRWDAEGELDRDAALTVAALPNTMLGSGPVALVLHAEGSAALVCEFIEVSELEPRLRKARPRPWQHSFTLWCDREDATTGEFFDALALAEPRLVSLAEPPVVAERDWPLASLRRRCHRAYELLEGTRRIATLAPGFRHDPGWTLEVTRREGASDEEWSRSWSVGSTLGVREVSSRTLRTDPVAWARYDWRRGAR